MQTYSRADAFTRSPLRRCALPVAAIASILTACTDAPESPLAPMPAAQSPASSGSPAKFHGVFLGDVESHSHRIGASIEDFAGTVGARPQVIKTFHRLDDDFGPAGWSGRTLREVAAAGAENFVALDLRWAAAPEQGLLGAIAGGEADAEIRRVARQLRELGRPVFVEPGWEMNGDWGYAWQPRANGGAAAPALYVAAWRRVVELFRAEAAHQVRWVFSPNVGNPIAGAGSGAGHWNWYGHYYPGADYVDYLGLHGFNAPTLWDTPYLSFAQLFDSAAADHMLSDMGRRFPHHPIIISEFASEEGGDAAKSEWIRDAYRRIAANPHVVGAVWFNMDKETDWRVNSTASSLAAYREALGDLGT